MFLRTFGICALVAKEEPAIDLCAGSPTLGDSWGRAVTKVGMISSLGDTQSICGDTLDGAVTGVAGRELFPTLWSERVWLTSLLFLSICVEVENSDAFRTF